MRKFFSYLGIFCLLLASFFFTEKTVNVVKEYSVNSKKEPVNAYIDGNTIIPGMNGYQVDIDKSYHNMKRYGKFDSSLLEYENIIPIVTMNDNKDKYIVIKIYWRGQNADKEFRYQFNAKDRQSEGRNDEPPLVLYLAQSMHCTSYTLQKFICA